MANENQYKRYLVINKKIVNPKPITRYLQLVVYTDESRDVDDDLLTFDRVHP